MKELLCVCVFFFFLNTNHNYANLGSELTRSFKRSVSAKISNESNQLGVASHYANGITGFCSLAELALRGSARLSAIPHYSTGRLEVPKDGAAADVRADGAAARLTRSSGDVTFSCAGKVGLLMSSPCSPWLKCDCFSPSLCLVDNC